MDVRRFTVALLALALFSSAAEAGRGRRPARGPTGTFKGVIAAVASNTVRVNVGTNTEKIVIFWTDAQTSITGGGKKGSSADLAEGQTVTVKARQGKATSIEVQVDGGRKAGTHGKGEKAGSVTA